MKINPFRPQSPVPPGMFAGRLQALESLESALFQTRAEQPTHFMITGERGIGKTSLLNYLKYIATGAIDVEGTYFKFLVLDTIIDENTTKFTLIKKIELGLIKELGKTEPARNFLREAWDFLKRLEAGGVKLRGRENEATEELLMEEFAYSLAATIERTCSDRDQTLFGAQYDGVLILVDEADNASKVLQMGAFFKILIEHLQRLGCEKLMVGLAGLSSLRSILRESHESSLRLFDEIILNRLSAEEVVSVIDKCLDIGAEKNSKRTDITDDARNALITLSEGYPHFIQQYGHSAFDVDDDWNIDRTDVYDGAFLENGALKKIGDRYYRDDFYNKIQKESYRQVLRIMADNLDGWTSKSDIRKRYRGKESTLTNAIQALRNRHIIFDKEGEKGVYRLQQKGFALWIKTYADMPHDFKNGDTHK